MKNNSLQSKNIRDIAFLSIMVAIIFILAFTPIGFINLVVIKATIIHIPVIIGSILLGPKKGAILGAAFGLASLLVNTLMPSLLSFAFSPLMPVPGLERGTLLALVVCFVPRILVGIVPWYVYKLVQKCMKKDNEKRNNIVSISVAAVAGSMTNTILVMSLIFILFKDAYATMKGISTDAVAGVVLGIVGMNGIPEAIVAAVLTAAICIPLKRYVQD